MTAQPTGAIVLAFDGSPGSRLGAKIAVQLATRLAEPIHVFVDSKDKGRAIARFDDVYHAHADLEMYVSEGPWDDELKDNPIKLKPHQNVTLNPHYADILNELVRKNKVNSYISKL